MNNNQDYKGYSIQPSYTQLKKSEIFDPRIIEENSNYRVWSSASVELAKNGLKEGYKLSESPFNALVKGFDLRKNNLPFKYTELELNEIRKCAEDKIYFASKYVKLKEGGVGWTNIELRDYQVKLLNMYTNNKWNIVMFPRQSGKSTTTIIDILHFLCFNFDKDMAVISKSDLAVSELVAKIKTAFSELPFFLQPGFVSFTKDSAVLDNGCRLVVGIASESVVQGYSLDYLYVDEFAYIMNGMAEKFWKNVYPTLDTNPNSKCVITSTPNGRNLFYKLWIGSINKSNKFANYRIYWQEVPHKNKTLEEFKAETIANVGIEGWLMGYECSFDASLTSIFKSQIQLDLRESQKSNESSYSYHNHYLGELHDIEFISQDIRKYDLKSDYFIFGIDLAEGLEGDYTILNIDLVDWNTDTKRLEYHQVGLFKSNTIGIDEFALKVMQIMKHFDPDKVKIVVENNKYGGEFFAYIKGYRDTMKELGSFNMSVFARFMRNSKNDYEYGILWDQSNKNVAVKAFSKLITNEVKHLYHNATIEESLNFCRQKNGSYSANYGHDDIVMSNVTTSYFITSNDPTIKGFFDQVELFLRIKYSDKTEEMISKEEEDKLKAERYIIKTPTGDITIRDHSLHVKPNKTYNDDFDYFGDLKTKSPHKVFNPYK